MLFSASPGPSIDLSSLSASRCFVSILWRRAEFCFPRFGSRSVICRRCASAVLADALLYGLLEPGIKFLEA
jgi:hypothetical protein